MKQNTPSTTPSMREQDQSLLTRAREVYDNLLQEIGKHKESLPPSKLHGLENMAESHARLMRILKASETDHPERLEAIIAEALESFPKAMKGLEPKNPETFKAAQAEARKHLQSVTAHIETQIPSIATKVSPQKVGEAAAKGDGFLRRLWNKHESFMEEKSSGTRLGIAVSEMVIGGILTDTGGRWISQSISGLKDGGVQQIDGPNGARTTTVIMTPMSKQERILKGVLGGATTSLGVGSTVMGFAGLFRGM